MKKNDMLTYCRVSYTWNKDLTYYINYVRHLKAWKFVIFCLITMIIYVIIEILDKYGYLSFTF